MRSRRIPFKIDLIDLLQRARRQITGRAGNVTISLPFISLQVSPKDREKQVAREVVIRLRDRRILSASECCDDCIDKALKSLQEIRALLTNKQVELSEVQDGPLFLLLDAMSAGIRDFMTFEERLHRDASPRSPLGGVHSDGLQQWYFDALEELRAHLSKCLAQVSTVAGMPPPAERLIASYQGPWRLEAYETPAHEP